VTLGGARGGSRILAVGADAEVCAALHPAAERAGHALWCLPSPAALEPVLRLAAPQLLVLVLPATPDASWGTALAAAAGAARVGIRVVVVAPARDVVEPLAAVAGAERAFSRAEVLARPADVVERLAAPLLAPAVQGPPLEPPPAPSPVPPPPPAVPSPAETAIPKAASGPGASARSDDGSGPAAFAPALEDDLGVARYRYTPSPLAPTDAGQRSPRRVPDLATLIDQELEQEPRNRPKLSRVEVNVSLVSEHNFYVGATRRVDSGGVFISTAIPPPVGTRLQIRLGLADGRKLDLDGEVAFIREKSSIGIRQPSGCGVRLIGLPGWAVDAVERFVHARPPIVWVGR
jgi:hypothetical protein